MCLESVISVSLTRVVSCVSSGVLDPEDRGKEGPWGLLSEELVRVDEFLAVQDGCQHRVFPSFVPP